MQGPLRPIRVKPRHVFLQPFGGEPVAQRLVQIGGGKTGLLQPQGQEIVLLKFVTVRFLAVSVRNSDGLHRLLVRAIVGDPYAPLGHGGAGL